MKIKLFTVPNFLTALNLFCGCVGMLFALRFDDLQMSFRFIVAAAVFDFLDGFAARLLKSQSVVGKELDSLADAVSFGVAPAAILFSMYQQSGGTGLWGYAVFGLAAFSALRLARFNVDTDSKTDFTGMPTPAMALFVAAAGHQYMAAVYSAAPYMMIAAAAVLSFLMICNLPMFSLKFPHYRWKGNELRYVFCLLSLAGLLVWGITAIPFIIAAYVAVNGVKRLV